MCRGLLSQYGCRSAGVLGSLARQSREHGREARMGTRTASRQNPCRTARSWTTMRELERPILVKVRQLRPNLAETCPIFVMILPNPENTLAKVGPTLVMFLFMSSPDSRFGPSLSIFCQSMSNFGQAYPVSPFAPNSGHIGPTLTKLRSILVDFAPNLGPRSNCSTTFG